MTESQCSELPRDAGCGGLARRLVEGFLSERRMGNLADDARIVVSELVNNAYLHGQGQIELTLQAARDGGLRIEVTDGGAGQVRLRKADELGGHGLQIVSRLSAAWGVERAPTRVWAELAQVAARTAAEGGHP